MCLKCVIELRVLVLAESRTSEGVLIHSKKLNTLNTTLLVNVGAHFVKLTKQYLLLLSGPYFVIFFLFNFNIGYDPLHLFHWVETHNLP